MDKHIKISIPHHFRQKIVNQMIGVGEDFTVPYYYPECKFSKKLADFSNSKTLSRYFLLTLQSSGYDIEVTNPVKVTSKEANSWRDSPC